MKSTAPSGPGTVAETGKLTESTSGSDQDPWVADLHGSSADGECQSTIGFDDHPCAGTPQWYVRLEILGYQAANPLWEGKLCNACLAGWTAWAAEEPNAVRVLSVDPIVTGE